MLYADNSLKKIFKNKLTKSKSYFQLPSISNTSLHFFQNSSNNSSISKYFFNQDLFAVRKLDINSRKTPFKLISNNSDIMNNLEKKRNQFIKDFKCNKKKNYESEEQKNFITERIGKKNIYNLSIMTNEKQLKDHLKIIEKEINKYKKEKENIKNKIIQLMKKTESNEVCLDIIKSQNNLKTHLLKDYDNMKYSKRESLEEYKIKRFNLMSSLQREFEENQVLKNNFLKEITLNKENIIELKKKENEIKEKLSELKEKYLNKKEELIQHYHYLLFEGLETRKEGLIWIIKSIWDLNEDVNMSFIPNFLDEKAIEYLFIVSNKSKCLSKIEKSIEEIRERNNKKNSKKENDYFKNNRLFKNNSFKDIMSYKIKLKKNQLEKKESIYNYLNKIDNKISNFYSFRNNHDNFLLKNKEKNIIKFEEQEKNYEELKKLKNKIVRDLEILKKNELRRISREFLQNDYERRFNVPIEIVLNALVGEKNLIQENEKQKNYKQEFIKNIKNCNFYRIFEKNNNIKNNF